MTTNLDSARPYGLGRLSTLLRGEPTLTREDIERDAAAQLSVGETVTTPETPETPEAPVAVHHDTRGRRLSGWLRRFGGESAQARRERIEREAAAELGLHDRQDQPAA